MTGTIATQAAATGLGLAIDRLVGEPPVLHPVAGFGTAMGRVERQIWQDRRATGLAYTAIGVGIGAVGGRVARSTALAVAVCAAGRELRSVAASIAERCEAGDLSGARELLPSLVGRDPSELDLSGIAAAVIESLAENTVDAVVAPALWGAVAGAPGAAGYRAINTMDAMVGHHNERYEHFGWSAARLDDLANFVPARAFAALVVTANPSRRAQIWDAIRTQAPEHPSPNAGVAEAAVAAALGVELGGPLRYGDRLEVRPALGRGPRPEPSDIARAIRLVDRVEIVLAAALVAPAALSALRTRLMSRRRSTPGGQP